jgi:hypothetical protein
MVFLDCAYQVNEKSAANLELGLSTRYAMIDLFWHPKKL